MKPSRKTQPYRKGSAQRSQGPALSAMVRGKPAFLPNPSHTPAMQGQSGGMQGTLSQQVAQQVPRRRKQKTRTPLTARTA